MTRTLTPIAILEQLVAFDTVSTRSNVALIDWLAEYLDGHGARVEVLRSDAGDKANLLATIGPRAPGGVVLSGHTDVVPVEGQAWRSEPFRLVADHDRLVGRGTVDMKGFLALAASYAPCFASLPLARPIHFAFSYDEEVGCYGAPHLVRRLNAVDPEAEIAIIGEPTGMRPVTGHKSCDLFRLEIVGKAAHSSAPARGANAILYASEFIHFVRNLFEDLQDESHRDPAFDPPYATFNVGRIEGGEGINIVASSCSVRWEFRTTPATDSATVLARIEAFLRDDLEPALRREYAEGRIELHRIASVPKLAPERNGAAEALARGFLDNASAGTAAFGSEAGLFQQAGLSCIVCGPGEVAQAHQPNEYITLQQLQAGEAFLRQLGQWATGARQP